LTFGRSKILAVTMKFRGSNMTVNPASKYELLWVLIAICLNSTESYGQTADQQTFPKPNIVLILADDLGYGDLGCYGSKKIRTPNLDRLADQGTRLTDFYVSQAVCSASRASLMTGCYANRVGMEGALNHTSPFGINSEEKLLPELLQECGYATGIFGKWHLGLSPHFSPLKNGFDRWVGIPYSNDNSKYHPALADQMLPLPWYSDDQVIAKDPDQSQFTQMLTDHAIEFIEQHAKKPFFVYLPHIMPHVPIFASDKFQNQSGHGTYADVVAELDDSVGRILQTIDRLGLSESTWVIFASDNGPFLSYGDHAGSAGKLREGKLTAFEGGVRVPCLMRWPGKIAAQRICSTPIMTIDLLPTITNLVGGKAAERKIDGLDVAKCLFGDAPTPHESFAFYNGDQLHAIRSGNWKLHLPHDYLAVDGLPGTGGKPAGYGRLKPQSIEQSGTAGIASRHGYRVERLASLALYDLASDPGESKDVASDHPEVVGELLPIVDYYRMELGDGLTKQNGRGVRKAGRQQ
jgi:arylsulfatase A-like enzyme